MNLVILGSNTKLGRYISPFRRRWCGNLTVSSRTGTSWTIMPSNILYHIIFTSLSYGIWTITHQNNLVVTMSLPYQVYTYCHCAKSHDSVVHYCTINACTIPTLNFLWLLDIESFGILKWFRICLLMLSQQRLPHNQEWSPYYTKNCSATLNRHDIDLGSFKRMESDYMNGIGVKLYPCIRK